MQTDYICREDAINFIENMTWYHVNRRGQLVDGANSDTGLYKAKDVYKGLHDIPAADVISKADMITLLEETEREVLKGINRYSTHWIMIDSIFGIIKCKVNMMGEKSNE